MIIFDLSMAIIFLIIGILFYKSNGKAAMLLSGYNTLAAKDRKSHEEEVEMCKDYGKRMMIMAVPFVVGAVVDFFKSGVGCYLAWAVWMILFILLMIARVRREK